LPSTDNKDPGKSAAVRASVLAKDYQSDLEMHDLALAAVTSEFANARHLAAGPGILTGGPPPRRRR
jgi:hypothetical protein